MAFNAYRVRVVRTSDSGTGTGGTQDDESGTWTPGDSGAGAKDVVLDWLDADVQEQGTNLVRQQSGEAAASADATIFLAAYRMGRIQTILRLLREGDIVEVLSLEDNVTRECELVRARAMDGTLYVRYLAPAVIP